MIARRSTVASLFGGFGRWKTVIALPVVILAAVAYAASFLLQPQYRAEVVFLVLPQQILPAYVAPALSARIEDDLRAVSAQVLNRARLREIIVDLNLYAEQSRAGAIDDAIIDDMLSHISVERERGDTFRISYTGPQPQVVQEVTHRLTMLVLKLGFTHHVQEADGTTTFLESALDETRRRLIDQGKRVHLAERQDTPSEELAVLRIEYETSVGIYKEELAKREQSRAAANAERLQLGEQFSILDRRLTPGRPISPNRWLMTLEGALTGLTLGILMLIGGWRRRLGEPPVSSRRAEATS